jgi:hypothetical protein
MSVEVLGTITSLRLAGLRPLLAHSTVCPWQVVVSLSSDAMLIWCLLGVGGEVVSTPVDSYTDAKSNQRN